MSSSLRFEPDFVAALLFAATVDRTRHMKDCQGQILALAFRYMSLTRNEVFQSSGPQLGIHKAVAARFWPSTRNSQPSTTNNGRQQSDQVAFRKGSSATHSALLTVWYVPCLLDSGSVNSVHVRIVYRQFF